ncbi:MAG: alpha-L-arabinofuranosidase C-terminal domain-containing protein, partial [Acetanaerobacterium sp.]
ADLYRRFQTYVHNYGDNKICKIACGPNIDDYAWTDEVMSIAGRYMDALTLHYYTLPTDVWNNKGSATDFDSSLWYATLKRTLKMDELISNHAQIMNKYDPAHRVGLIVDEWGAWYDVEPGTNPGFLYQQNTMRDALIAAINLNIFNLHSDRVVMANLAQMVNVLQSVILTEGEKIILTPTYHVFDLFKAHQDATLVDSFIETKQIGEGDSLVPNLSQSVSISKDNEMHITIANLSVTESYPVNTALVGYAAKKVNARIITGEMHAHNTFENKNTVGIKSFSDYNITSDGLDFTIPPCSVLAFTIN